MQAGSGYRGPRHAQEFGFYPALNAVFDRYGQVIFVLGTLD